jgi:cyclopropane-fatty-acyl-phospholipid synthase
MALPAPLEPRPESASDQASPPAHRRLDRPFRNLFLSRLERLETGEITLLEGPERHVFGRQTPEFPCSATIRVLDPKLYRNVVLRGNIGAAESYMDGHWTSGELTELIRILARGWNQIGGLGQAARFVDPFLRLYHRLHRNTRRGSRRNVAAHYDLGNEFFELFLDPTLTYSCGVFERPDDDVEAASIAKYDRICRKLELGSGDEVLEIGTGWGGFAIHAAGSYGCRVTTTTISSEQYQLATARVHKAGLSDRVTLLKRDYRDLEGRFDKLVSIEMIEAVGERYLDTFFKVCNDLLAPGGMMCLQAITTSDQNYRNHVRSNDFIKRYIFPGGSLVSVGRVSEALARVTDMRIFNLEDITPHYATTLRMWRERFLQNLHRFRDLGYPESFIKMWEFYLCYCEGGFLERVIGDVQILLTKPLCRRASVLS